MKVDKELHVKNISSFYFSLREEIETNSHIIIDFSDTVRIDSSAAQIILSAVNKVKELDKSIRFIGVSSELGRLLNLAGIKLQQ